MVCISEAHTQVDLSLLFITSDDVNVIMLRKRAQPNPKSHGMSDIGLESVLIV